MTKFNRLKPVVLSVSLLSTLSFASLAAVRHHPPHNYHYYDQAKSVAFNDAVLDQNQGGIVVGALNRPDWVKRINVSGLINVDAIAQNRTPAVNYNFINNSNNFITIMNSFSSNHKSNDIGLSDANLFVDAKVNHWMNTHFALLFRDENKLQALRQYRKGDDFQSPDLTSYFNNNNLLGYQIYSNQDKSIRLDEAYFTLGNLEKNPFYLRAGRLYVPFGEYQRYSITNSLTQLLSQTSETAIEIGKAFDNRFNASVYAFRGIVHGYKINSNDFDYKITNGKLKVRNWGAQLAYAENQPNAMYNVGIGYLHNMSDVDYLRAGLGNITYLGGGYVPQIQDPEYLKATPAVSIHADARIDEFDAGFRYVSALEKFNVLDIPFKNHGARPRAATLDFGYSFDLQRYHSRLGLTYQVSKEAKNLGPVWLGLPSHRYGAELQVNIMNRTDVVFSLMRDKDYSVAKGGTGKNLNTAMARLSVAFA